MKAEKGGTFHASCQCHNQNQQETVNEPFLYYGLTTPRKNPFDA